MSDLEAIQEVLAIIIEACVERAHETDEEYSWYRDDDDFIDDSEFLETGDSGFVRACECIAEVRDAVDAMFTRPPEFYDAIGQVGDHPESNSHQAEVEQTSDVIVLNSSDTESSNASVIEILSESE